MRTCAGWQVRTVHSGIGEERGEGVECSSLWIRTKMEQYLDIAKCDLKKNNNNFGSILIFLYQFGFRLKIFTYHNNE